MKLLYIWGFLFIFCWPSYNSQKVVRVLSIDAGGIRGIIAAKVLEKLERELKKPIAHTFDLIAGSSAGALLTLGLTLDDGTGNPKYSAEELVKFYDVLAHKAFHRSLGRKIWSLDGWIAPKYSSKGIKKLLENFFGESRLSEAITPVLITEYHASTGTGIILTSIDAKKDSDNFDCLLTEAARASIAAPTFFKAGKINFANKTLVNLIDGGVFVYNPALLSYGEAKKHFPHAEIIEVYSLGTGGWSATKRNVPKIQSGKVHWAQAISTHLLLGQINSTNQVLDILLNQNSKNNFHRLDITLKGQSRRMDDTSDKNLHDLHAVAQKLIQSFEMHQAIAQLKINFLSSKKN